MVTYYTALGRMVTQWNGTARIPVVLIEGDEFHLSVDELLVWGSLHWNILNKEMLEREYSRRKAKDRIFNDTSFEQILKRLETRGLVISGTDYLAADALYNLIGKLRIRPVRFTLWDKINSFLYMYFKKGLTLKRCKQLFFDDKITESERNILQLSKRVGITAAEIIQCVEKNVLKIKDEEEIMKRLYTDSAVTYETILAHSRFSALKSEVLQSVANLYLKKKIIFEY